MIHVCMEAAETEVTGVRKADSLPQRPTDSSGWIPIPQPLTSCVCEPKPAPDQSGLTADLQRGLQLQEDGLAQEDLPGLEAEASDLPLRQLDVLPRPGTFN